MKFQWYPRWISILACAPLLAVIVMMILMRRTNGTLPFSADAWAAWKKGKLIFALTLLVAILAGIPVMAIAGDQFGLVAVFAILALVIAAPIAAWVTFLRNRGPVCTKIDKGLTFLKIPSDSTAQRIQQHLSAGRAAPAAMPAA